MLLFLKVLTHRGKPPSHDLSRLFDAGGGTVGRSSSNQLSLPDREGFISRQHGTISYRDGHYNYTDTSTGGTYFTNRNLLLEQDSLVLRQGDTLRIGEYEIAVSLLPDSETATPAHVQRFHSAQDLFQAFLQGAELEHLPAASAEELPVLMRSIGALLRAVVEGTLALSRASAGMADPAPPDPQNNPLGPAAAIDDALAFLLRPGSQELPSPLDAVRDRYGDLLRHWLAMNAATQTELSIALRRFDPEGIKRFGGIQSGEQCWEAYRKAYPGVARDITENFFGEEFAKTYERQLSLLRRSKVR